MSKMIQITRCIVLGDARHVLQLTFTILRPAGKWKAQITREGVRYNLGEYVNQHEVQFPSSGSVSVTSEQCGCRPVQVHGGLCLAPAAGGWAAGCIPACVHSRKPQRLQQLDQVRPHTLSRQFAGLWA